MAAIDHAMESVLALVWMAVTAMIAFAVLAWVYAVVFVGGTLLELLVALLLIGFGAVIVYGSLMLYAPTVNPVEAFRHLLTYHWADERHYYCETCRRSFTQPGSLSDFDCPYCGAPDPDYLAG